MECCWTEEQRRGAREARQFAERELNGHLSERLSAGELDRSLWRRCAGFGVQGLMTPAEYGGIGLDVRSSLCVLAGLGRGCLDNGLLMALGAQLWSVVPPLLTFGSEAQKRQWLPALSGGDCIGALALTEAEGGSDALRLRARAEAEGGGFRLHATKQFVTNAPAADLFLVFAATDPAAGYMGISAFLVPRLSAGLSVSPPLRKMGLESGPMGEVRLDGVLVGSEAVLGAVGGGGAVLACTLEWERGGLLAPATGTMERLLQQTLAYTRARKQFGRPIIQFEAVGQQLAEMRLRIELSRLLLYQFASLKDLNRPAAAEASMTKLYVSESLRYCAATALHLHGAAGYTKDYEFERVWRDAMASSIYSGTTEMQYNLIGESLLRAAPAATGTEDAPARAERAA